MAALEKGITANGKGYGGKTWNILGQVYFPKAVTDFHLCFRDQQRARPVRAGARSSNAG